MGTSSLDKTYTIAANTSLLAGTQVPVLGVPPVTVPPIIPPATFLIENYTVQGTTASLGNGSGAGNRSGAMWVPEADGAGGAGRIYVIQNNGSILFELDPDNPGVVTREIATGLNGSNNDTEGCYYNVATDEVFICSENAGHHKVHIFPWIKGVSDDTLSGTERQVLTVAATETDNNSGSEGIAFNPDLGVKGVFYVVGEGYQASSPRRLFRFERPTNEVTDYAYTDAELTVVEIVDAEARFPDTGATHDFSDCLLAPNGHLLIMSHIADQIGQIDVEDLFTNHNTSPTHDAEAITFVSTLALPANYQWEGMTFYGDDDDLFCVSEPTLYIKADAPDAPVITAMADIIITLGTTLQFTPTLSSGVNVFWSLAYAHDDVEIDPDTGEITWDTSAIARGQGAYIGVRAYNKAGSNVAWRRVLLSSDGTHLFRYCGHNEVALTIEAGLLLMNSGDCLILRDGEYSARPNDSTFENGFYYRDGPPAGTNTQMTTFMSETPLGARVTANSGFDTPAAPFNRVFGFTGTHEMVEPRLQGEQFSGASDRNYIKLLGLYGGNSTQYAPFNFLNCNYLMLELCASFSIVPEIVTDFGGGGSTGRFEACANVLIESCLDFGSNNRYHWQFKEVDRGIHRRSIGRSDNYHGSQPLGGFCAYTCMRCLQQDNYDIDGNQLYWTYHGNWAGSSSWPATNDERAPRDHILVGMITVNTDKPVIVYVSENYEEQTALQASNVVNIGGEWSGSPLGRWYAGIIHATGPVSVTQMTIAGMKRQGNTDIDNGSFLYSRGHHFDVNNSILYRLGYDHDTDTQYDAAPLTRWPVTGIGSDWNGDPRTWELNYVNIDPLPFILNDGYPPQETATTYIDPSENGLIYPIRIEAGSVLETAGAGGIRQGADCQFYAGKSWTFRDEAGWNTPTTKRRFPIAIEDIVKEPLQSYSFTGINKEGSGTLSGSRGTQAADENLSYHIWEALGTAVPPLRFASKSFSSSVKLYWEAPPLKYSVNVTGFNIYRDGSLLVAVASTDYQYLDTTATTGVNYDYTIRTVDSVLGESGDSYVENVTVI